jgi:carbamoylphosphate synthase large subunit
MEAALTTMIVGVGTVSILQLLASGTVTNINACELTTGSNVAKDLHEAMLQKTYAQVLAMNATSYQPPWDSRSQAISTLPDWQQAVTVQPVSADNLTQSIIDANPDAVRITVTVAHNSREVCSTSWYSFKP